jgi:hypothetical protein
MPVMRGRNWSEISNKLYLTRRMMMRHSYLKLYKIMAKLEADF